MFLEPMPDVRLPARALPGPPLRRTRRPADPPGPLGQRELPGRGLPGPEDLHIRKFLRSRRGPPRRPARRRGGVSGQDGDRRDQARIRRTAGARGVSGGDRHRRLGPSTHRRRGPGDHERRHPGEEYRQGIHVCRLPRRRRDRARGRGWREGLPADETAVPDRARGP
ncbi:hypothetical protein DSECCO2_517110 [anaerobic digester metagenome]